MKNIAKSGKALCEKKNSHFLAFYVKKGPDTDVIFLILVFYHLFWNIRGLGRPGRLQDRGKKRRRREGRDDEV